MKTKTTAPKAPNTRSKRTRRPNRKWKVVSDVWPRVYQRNPDFGPVVYRVDSRRNVAGETTGKRVEFETLEDAQAETQRLRERFKMHGAAANISASSTNEAHMALRLLEQRAPGVSLLEAVKGYVELVAKIRNPITMSELAKQYAESKQSRGRSAGHVKDLKFRLKKFGEKFGKRLVHEISGEQVEKWIESMKLTRGVGADGESQTISVGSQANYWRNLSSFFSYSVANGHAALNPLEGRERPQVPTGEVGILTVDELTRVLSVADERIIPALVLGAFAGLRPEAETILLNWEDINLDKVLDEDKSTKRKPVYKSFGYVNVRRSKNKASVRHVPISENLHDWLIDRKPATGGPVVPVAKNYLAELRQAAAIEAGVEWPHDALRHSFASYHRAAHQSDHLTMTLLGHTNMRTFKVHYCHSLPPGAAESYWNIFPTVRGERKIVPLAAAG
jgi:integrase